MNKFTQIDKKLNKLARQLGTTVATSGGGHSFDEVVVPKDKLEMRRIVWIEGSIGKGIVIDQNFENRNIDVPDWDFMNIAWLAEGGSSAKGRPFWQTRLLKKVKLAQIEKNIDQLLKKSIDNLKAIKESDLGYN